MGCSTNQPMPDPHTVERISASKKNPTCEDDGMMLSVIEIRQDTSNFLRATPLLMFNIKSGSRPPNFENERQLITQDIRAPFDVPCSIPCWMMLPTARLSKVSLFRICDPGMLSPDNRVSDPTDLAVKPDNNRFRIMMGIVIK